MQEDFALNSPRRPRFERQDPPPFNPTNDDRTMIRHLIEHRFLRATHLARLMARPHDKILRRLATLFHNGYVDRPSVQRDLFGHGANIPIIYAPGRKSSQLFGALSDEDWPERDRTVSRPYMEHALITADFMVALECAMRSLPTIRLLRAVDIVDDVHRATGAEPRSWTMTVHIPDDDLAIAAAPDKVFALEFLESGRRNYFLLETDRSTMPVERRSLEQSSFRKKLLAYHLGHQLKRHVALWGIPGFRVLTITKSADRIASMIETLKKITDGKGSNVFLFATIADALGDGPLTVTWRTGKDNRVQLVS